MDIMAAHSNTDDREPNSDSAKTRSLGVMDSLSGEVASAVRSKYVPLIYTYLHTKHFYVAA